MVKKERDLGSEEVEGDVEKVSSRVIGDESRDGFNARKNLSWLTKQKVSLNWEFLSRTNSTIPKLYDSLIIKKVKVHEETS